MAEPIAFYIGLHQPSDARHFERACISVNRLRRRKGPFLVDRWIMDSGAFSELALYGRYRHQVAAYADDIRRWVGVGQLDAVVAQDYMCEPFMVAKTGLSVGEHQRLTIERYDELLAEQIPVHVMPVLQGFHPAEYTSHLSDYGPRLTDGMWVGVGSVCKRNGDPGAVAAVLETIATARPDLRLHGFGLKLTAFQDAAVREFLHSADSMAWSFAARRQGRNANDWREAAAYCRAVHTTLASRPKPRQLCFNLAEAP